jgi:hypothetical protein
MTRQQKLGSVRPPNDNPWSSGHLRVDSAALHADRDEPGSSSTDSELDDPAKYGGEILATNTFGSEP